MKVTNKGLLPASIVLLFLMVGPFLTIILFSFLTSGDYGGIVYKFSYNGYIKLLYDIDFNNNFVFDFSYIEIILRSITLSLISVFICFLIGFPTAYFIAFSPVKVRVVLLLLITIPFWTNLLVRTISWIGILRDNGILNNFLITLGIIKEPLPILYSNYSIILGLVYSYIPFMVLPIYSSLEKLDTSLIEASYDLYANKLKTLMLVTIPLVKQAIFSGCILVFIPGMGAYIAPDLLGGSKKLMLGNLIKLQFTSSRDWAFGAALATILTIFIMISLLLQAFLSSRKEKKNVY